MTKKLLILPVAMLLLALGSIGSASAQTGGPRVALQFGSSGLTSPLTASSSNAVLARLILDTTGSSESVRISSLPFNLVTANGALASTLENCLVYNESQNSVALNSSNNSMSWNSGVNSVNLNSPLILAPNTISTLSLRCDVDSSLVSGGTYTVNMNTGNLLAVGAVTGAPAVVTVRGAVVPPVYVPPVVYPPVYTPGVPSTGADAEQTRENLMILAGSLLVGTMGLLYARRQANA